MKKEIFTFYSSIPKTISQIIYEYLKDSIINNNLKPGSKINEKEIATLFKISATPVREAVLKLGAEGYVDIDTHRQASVKKISFEELNEIFKVLGVLDGLAGELIVDYLTPEIFFELEKMTTKMEGLCNPKSIDQFLELNIKIHKVIWNALPQKFLRSTLLYVNDQRMRYNYAHIHAYQQPGILEVSMEKHRSLLLELKRKDKNRLKVIFQEHWDSFLKLSLFKQSIEEIL